MCTILLISQIEPVLCSFALLVNFVFSSPSNDIECSQMEMQEFKEPILADIKNIQQEKAELEEVGMYAFCVLYLS